MTFSPLAWLQSHWITPREIRAEVWALGGRHRGKVLEGARLEAKSPHISARRSILLRAVIRNQAAGPLAKALSSALSGRRGERR